MIKSSKLSTKFANTTKRNNIVSFINDYRSLMLQFIDRLWDEPVLPKFITKELTDGIKTNLSAAIIQCAGKQTIAIIKGTKKKQNNRIWMANKLHIDGKHKQARKLETFISKTLISKPTLNNVNPELDNRFIKFDFNNKTSFDAIITLSGLYYHQKIIIPVKLTKHFNLLSSKGTIKTGIRLNPNCITVMFDINDPPKITTGDTLGIDIGQTDLISCSNGFQSVPDHHGHTLKSICNKLARKQRGSKAFRKAQDHRTNFINHSINQLNLIGIKEVKIENIKNMGKGRITSRSLRHWNYAEIFGKISSKCADTGVQLKRVSPSYTSQRCSVCGWTRKANRRSKSFKCTSCGFVHDADLNAAINISLDLKPIGKQERLAQINRKGFYWLAPGQEPIVPVVPETSIIVK